MIRSDKPSTAMSFAKRALVLTLAGSFLSVALPSLATPADNSTSSKPNASGTSDKASHKSASAKTGQSSSKLAKTPVTVVESTTTTTTTTTTKTSTHIASGTGKPKIIEFSAAWCVPCKKMAPMIHKLEVDYAGKAQFQSVDFDKDTDIVTKYDVTSVPTVIIINGAGKISYQHAGSIDEKTMTTELAKVIAK
jgi:thioredoxin 1